VPRNQFCILKKCSTKGRIGTGKSRKEKKVRELERQTSEGKEKKLMNEVRINVGAPRGERT